jgi:predicted metal-binding protein
MTCMQCGGPHIHLNKMVCNKCAEKIDQRRIDDLQGRQRLLTAKMQQICHAIAIHKFTALDVHCLTKLSGEWTDLDKRIYEAKRRV